MGYNVHVHHRVKYFHDILYTCSLCSMFMKELLVWYTIYVHTECTFFFIIQIKVPFIHGLLEHSWFFTTWCSAS